MTPDTPPPPKRRRSKRGLFIRGLVTLLPAVVTILIFAAGIDFVRRYVTQPINSTIYWSLEGNGLGWSVLEDLGIDPTSSEFLDPEALPPVLADMRQALGTSNKEFQQDLTEYRAQRTTFFRNFDELAIDGTKLRKSVKDIVHPMIGVLMSLLLIVVIGYFGSGFIGRHFIAAVDRGLHTVPVVRSIYPYTKQLVDFFLSDTELEFESVVAVPYPSEGLWSLGLVTGRGLRTLENRAGEAMISCFMPTSPMPMTGYTVFIPARKVVPLSISVDEALRITISGGVLVPPVEKVEDLENQLAGLGAKKLQPVDDEADEADEARTSVAAKKERAG